MTRPALHFVAGYKRPSWWERRRPMTLVEFLVLVMSTALVAWLLYLCLPRS